MIATYKYLEDFHTEHRNDALEAGLESNGHKLYVDNSILTKDDEKYINNGKYSNTLYQETEDPTFHSSYLNKGWMDICLFYIQTTC